MKARRWTAAVLVVWWLADPAAAVELMTRDGYRLAAAGDERSRQEADSYVGGTLDSLFIMNDILAADGMPLFCVSDEEAEKLDTERLKQEFTNWLKSPAATDRPGQENVGTLPVAALSWGFLMSKFTCPESDMPEGGSEELRSLLLKSIGE